MVNSIATISLATLARNIEHIRAHLPKGLKILFSVKSDGYGHGLVEVSRTAAEVGIEYLGAGAVEEGKKLRICGISLPILLLSPILPYEIRAAVELDLTLQVSDIVMARSLSQVAGQLGKKACVHVNVDTGMRRFGILPQYALSLFEQLRGLDNLEVEGVFSHLPVASSKTSRDRAYTRDQIKRFTSFLTKLHDARLLPPLRHIGNSAGVIQYMDLATSQNLNMVRIGDLFYGYCEAERHLRVRAEAVATLTARVIALKDVAPGERVGYGHTYQVSRSRRHRLAVVSIGYGSGLNGRLSNCGQVWVRRRLAPVVGKICLNHTIVDVTDVKGVSLGDTVEVFGPHLPADCLGEMAGLGVSEVRVPALQAAEARVYD